MFWNALKNISMCPYVHLCYVWVCLRVCASANACMLINMQMHIYVRI